MRRRVLLPGFMGKEREESTDSIVLRIKDQGSMIQHDALSCSVRTEYPVSTLCSDVCK